MIAALCSAGTGLYAQERGSTVIENSLSELKSAPIPAVRDSLPNGKEPPLLKPTDSLPAKETLEYIVDHSADSLVRQDLRNNKLILYDNAHVTYGDIDLKAGHIVIDNNAHTIFARGLQDSINGYTQLPVFTQGSQESVQDSLVFNFKSEKAKIWRLRTEQEGLIIKGKQSKKYNDSIIFIKDIQLTSSQKENPDYYIRVKKAKFIKDKKLVTGAGQLVIADVPTPAILPFAYVPMTKGRTAGFLMPTWGENSQQGYFLQNGGYYFVVNDYVDLALLGDIYTNGSWGLRAQSIYKKRYKYSGNLSFRYENLINGLRGLVDYAKTTNYNIRWSHSQDAKASPNSRFSASVNMGSSQYFKQSNNEYNNNAFLNNTLSSSVSFYKKFVGTPLNMSLSVTHSQNTNTQKITMTLPSLQLNMDRVYPFAGKGGSKKNALQKTGFTYSMRGENRVNTSDEFFFKKEMFDNAKSGIQQNVSMNTSIKALKYFTLSPSVNYKEVWYFDRLSKTFDDVQNAVVTDTISGFNAFREYSTALSVSTTLYGMFPFKKGAIEAIRHTVRPSVSYSYRPDFSFYDEQYQASDDPTDIQEYSPFSNGLYGSPGGGLSNSLNFTLNNNLEAKLRKKDSTETESKKIVLLNNLNFTTSYNMAADSLKWSPLRANAGTKLFDNKLSLNARATMDPYALDATGRKINTFNINNGGSLFRITNAGLTMNYRFDSKDGKKEGGQSGQERQNANDGEGIFGQHLNTSNDFSERDNESSDQKEATLYRASIPWTVNVAYSLNYSNSQRQDEITSHSLMFSGDIELTPKWGLGFSSGYDVKNRGFTYTQLRFSRDLDSWKLNFNWVPFGLRKTYYFFIGIKSAMLSDLKYEKRKTPDQVLF